MATLRDGLVSFWPLLADSVDVHGGNNGTDTACSYSADGVTGNGSTSKIDLGTAAGLNITGDMSIACWLKITSHGYHFILTRCDGNGGSQATYEFRTDPSGKINFGVQGGPISSAASLSTGTWYFVVVTRDEAAPSSDAYKIYINGRLDAAAGNGNHAVSLPAKHSFIGTRDDGGDNLGGYFVKGLTVYNKVLSHTEQLLLMNSGVPITYAEMGEEIPGLMDKLRAYYPFDGNALDAFRARDGVVTGAPTYPAAKIAQGVANIGGSSGNYVRLPDITFTTNIFSISAWVYINAWAGGGTSNTIIGAGSFNGFYVNGTTHKPTFFAGAYKDGTIDVPFQQWAHVVVTYDGADLRFYVNGVAAGVQAASITDWGSGQNVYTLSLSGSAINDGGVDELAVYDGRVLSADDVLELFAEGDGFAWPFPVPTGPVVTSIDPAEGYARGGTPVTITGSNFVDGATVTIGGAPATDVEFVDDTTITAVTPAGLEGLVDVVVTNPDDQVGTLVDGFLYTANPFSVTVRPEAGTSFGRTQGIVVTITDGVEILLWLLVARFPNGDEELITNGERFAARYATSSRRVIEGGYEVTVRRTGGWPDSVTLDAYGCDENGVVL